MSDQNVAFQDLTIRSRKGREKLDGE